MLTHHDRTMDDPVGVYEQIRGCGLRYVGFKDIGVPVAELREVCALAHADGLEVMLEVVSTTREEELRSVAASAETGVDWLLGGTHPEDGLEILAGRVGQRADGARPRYCPFPGTVVGHPSILQGEIGEIAESARRITGLDGVFGLDLLAYRHQTADPAELTRAVVQAASGPVIAAGSVVSTDQIRALDQAGAWGFTIGGAIFEGRLPGGPSIAGQVTQVLRATAKPETFIVWDRASGAAIYPAISWRDTRAADRCDELRRAGHEPEVRERTGLPLQPAFSAAKLAWLLDSVPGARRGAAAGELLFGDVNCWLIWNLSGRVAHVTEPSMAARTMLFNHAESAWDRALLDMFGIPARMLPAVTDTAGRLAVTDPRVSGGRAVIGASIGDQQAALFGQRCWREGMAKLTLGTGAFLWCHAGAAPPDPLPHRLASTSPSPLARPA